MYRQCTGPTAKLLDQKLESIKEIHSKLVLTSMQQMNSIEVWLFRELKGNPQQINVLMYLRYLNYITK